MKMVLDGIYIGLVASECLDTSTGADVPDFGGCIAGS